MIAIASGGCNVLSYLTADPAGVTAVDLNGAHIALGKLKICALKNLPDYDTFFRFFGRADAHANVGVYDRVLRAKLDPMTRAYWDKRRAFGRRRIGLFARNFYRHGLLGHFLGAGHALARLHGIDPSVILEARTLEEQRRLYEDATRADLQKAAGSLDDEAAGVSLWPRHPSGPVRRARGRFAHGHWRGVEPEGRASRLRFRRGR